ncbi:exfoliative toxin A/B [Spiroplasma sp. SV19]|uniref:SLAC1 family transporter n=1 Tax=Spiroplasma sp. SV19 TaxID=2570468 RepID=UPI0024B77968|nr:exfoliative toxin A/B [Spiroplasma sp. SV19]
MQFIKNFYLKIANRPLALSGAALGTATMGNAWGMFQETNIGFSFNCWWLKYITISFAMLIVILILLKYIFSPKTLIKEFKDPTLSNFIPTILMTCFVISGFYGEHNIRMLQLVIWVSCVVIHLVYIVLFCVFHIYYFKWENFIASWFVPPIGIVVACVMSKDVGTNISTEFASSIHQLSQFCWYLGFAFYVVMLPLMIYKYSFTNHLLHKKIAAYGIMAAPPNLLLAGYFSTFNFQEIARHYNLFIFFLVSLAFFLQFLFIFQWLKPFKLNLCHYLLVTLFP